MRLRTFGIALSCLIAIGLTLTMACNNTLNPFCGSARPAPLIASLTPSTVPFSQIQQGVTLTVTGNQFVSASELMINSTPLGATVVSPQKMTVKLTTDVITGPGNVSVAVETPSGNTSDLGCTSGGKSSVLTLTVN
jgi:hypothetical protein